MISSSRTMFFLHFGLRGRTKGKNGGFDSRRGRGENLSKERKRQRFFSPPPPTSTNEDNSNKCKREGENG